MQIFPNIILNPTVEDIAKFVAISNPEYTESIMQINWKQAKLQQIVVSEKMLLHFIVLYRAITNLKTS